MQNKEQFILTQNKWATEREILQELKKSPIFYGSYQALNSDWSKDLWNFAPAEKPFH